MTLHDLWTRHLAEECALVRKAMVASGWRWPEAAEALGVRVSTLQRVFARHPELVAERNRERPKRERHGGRWPGGEYRTK